MTESQDQASTAALSAMKRPQLQAIANQLDLTGTSRLRKNELIDAIRAGSAKQAGAAKQTGAAKTGNADEAGGAQSGEATAPARATSSQGRDGKQPASEQAGTGAAPAADERGPRTGSSRGRSRGNQQEPTLDIIGELSSDSSGSSDSSDSAGKSPGADRPSSQSQKSGGSRGHQAGASHGQKSGGPGGGAPSQRPSSGSRPARNNARGQAGAKPDQGGKGQPRGRGDQTEQKSGSGQGQTAPDEKFASLDDIIHFPSPQDRDEHSQQSQSQGPAHGESQGQDSDGDRNSRRRRGRDRGRDRKRRTPRESSGFDEDDILEDDVLVPVAGILDVLDNYAFVRTTGYLAGTSDVYVNLGQVRKSGLRRGDAITGAVRQPREGENSHRQKYNALVRLDSINGTPVDDVADRPGFYDLIPVYPQHPMQLETAASVVAPRIIDTIAPIGLGQRGLIYAPAGAGRSTLLQQIAAGITTNHPQTHLMMVLVDERPEDVTLMQRSVQGEVIASTFDRQASDHTTIAELAVERAKRLVELGQDVVVLLDSLTTLTRAYQAGVPSNRAGRGLDSNAIHMAKKLFGAARKVENAGSLTIVGTLLTYGDELNSAIVDEFSGTATSQLHLDSELAQTGIFPAINVHASATRRESELFEMDELAHRMAMRRMLIKKSPEAALAWLREGLEGATTGAFLKSIKVTPAEKAALTRSEGRSLQG